MRWIYEVGCQYIDLLTNELCSIFHRGCFLILFSHLWALESGYVVFFSVGFSLSGQFAEMLPKRAYGLILISFNGWLKQYLLLGVIDTFDQPVHLLFGYTCCPYI